MKMKKNVIYVAPAINVVEMEIQASLLAGSGENEPKTVEIGGGDSGGDTPQIKNAIWDD